jgi:hypothetical protein
VRCKDAEGATERSKAIDSSRRFVGQHPEYFSVSAFQTTPYGVLLTFSSIVRNIAPNEMVACAWVMLAQKPLQRSRSGSSGYQMPLSPLSDLMLREDGLALLALLVSLSDFFVAR